MTHHARLLTDSLWPEPVSQLLKGTIDSINGSLQYVRQAALIQSNKQGSLTAHAIKSGDDFAWRSRPGHPTKREAATCRFLSGHKFFSTNSKFNEAAFQQQRSTEPQAPKPACHWRRSTELQCGSSQSSPHSSFARVHRHRLGSPYPGANTRLSGRRYRVHGKQSATLAAASCCAAGTNRCSCHRRAATPAHLSPIKREARMQVKHLPQVPQAAHQPDKGPSLALPKRRLS